jgi:alpha-mannosidase
MRILMLAIVLLPSLLCAQVDLPVFGKQQVINGYAKDVEGEVLSYFSVYPEHATTALLTRCTDGTKAIAWETAVVPFSGRSENGPVLLLQLDRRAQQHHQRRGRSFDLYINDQLALTFTTHHNTKPGSWSAAGADSTKLVFEFSKADRHGDAHGFAHLRVPRKYITPGPAASAEGGGPRAEQPGLVHDLPVHLRGEGGGGGVALPNQARQTEIQVSLMTNMHFGET